MLEEEDVDVDFISAGIKGMDVETDAGGEKAGAVSAAGEEKK